VTAHRRWLALVVALGVGALSLPLVWAAVGSLTPEERLLAPGRGGGLVLDHYVALLSHRDFWTPVANSLLVAGATTFLCLVLGSPCAWAMARLEFRGKRAVLALLLSASMLPPVSVISPLYLALRALGLVDTIPGLVVPTTAFALPLAVWFQTAVFRALPRELEEAALVDGAGRLTTFVRIVLPLAAPGLATTAVLTFVAAWNEFLFALSFTTDPAHQTVPVAIALFRGQYQIPWGEILAATCVATAPVALLALVFQRRIVGGLAAGAVKG
jgi:ABC-type glycerol-3-phosphate transport system permease component